MIEFTSNKVKPYVYMGIHKTTGGIYFGYREENVKLSRPSDVDLPLYRTSSKEVRLKFDDYKWYIIAEFNNGTDAYDFEQQLIYENWNNHLLINNACYYGKMRFKSHKGKKGGNGGANKGKCYGQQTIDHKEHLSAAKKGKIGRVWTEEEKDKLRKPKAIEIKQKMSKPKIKVVTRLFDRKPMAIQHFNQWLTRQEKKNAFI